MSYEELRNNLLRVVEDAVKYSRDMDIPSLEAFAFSKSILKIYENMGVVENRTGTVQGIGIRAAVGKKVGFSSCTGFNDSSIMECIQKAYTVAQKVPDNPAFPGFISNNQHGKEGILDSNIIDLTPGALIKQLKELQAGIDIKDERIVVLETEVEAEYGGYAIATSEGLLQSNLTCAHSGQCYAGVLSNQERKTHSDYKIGRNIQDFTGVGQNAVSGALNSLGSKNLTETQTLPLIFHPHTAASMLGSTLARMLNGDLFVENRTPWKEKVGEQIAINNLNLEDNGQLLDSIRACAIDAEGSPVHKTDLISNGILNTFLFDKRQGLAAGKDTTGNAYRGINMPFEQTPYIAPHKLIIKPHQKDLSQIISEYDKAIYIEETPTGLHTVNIMNGDFSVTSNNAFLIENGEKKYSLNNISISGNLYDALNNILNIGNDLTVTAGVMDSPTIVIGNITFSG